MSPDLRYNILEAHLFGRIDELSINAQAGAGGRAGTKTRGALVHWLANNPFATRIRKTSRNPGGPLPMGFYELVLHEKRNNWIRLNPFSANLMLDRAGFAIHGRGARGSDGCIVPTDFNVVLEICRVLRKRSAAGQPAPILEAIALGDFGRWERAVA